MLQFIAKRVLHMIPTLFAVSIKQQSGFGQPVYVQYAKRIRNIVTKGDLGRSFAKGRPVTELICSYCMT